MQALEEYLKGSQKDWNTAKVGNPEIESLLNSPTELQGETK